MSAAAAAISKFKNAIPGTKAALMMVVVQATVAGVNVLYKLAANFGMSLHVIVAYRFVFATAFMAPLALVFERKNRPKLTWRVLMMSFFCGLFGGSMGQNLYLESLALTSATYASAMANLVPAATFILAVCLGMEKLRLGSMAGKAKVIGTLLGVGGAMLLTFYKGIEINLWNTHVNLLTSTAASGHSPAAHQPSNGQAIGSLLAVLSCISYALWLIIQAKMSNIYPAHYTSTALMCVMGTVQSVVYALCRERDWAKWRLGWNVGLLTSLYAGIVVSGVSVTLTTWCVRMKGPLFVSVFNPLMLVLVALAASMLLDEKLYLGSVLGGALIIFSLYVVLWGKAEEMKMQNRLMTSSSTIDPGNLSNHAHAFEIVVPSSPMVNNDILPVKDSGGSNSSIVSKGLGSRGSEFEGRELSEK